MIEKLPYYYRKSQFVKDVYEVVQTALDKITADISAGDLNLFITTASDFVLHEKDVKLPNDTSIDSETRRAKVLARLQGNEVLTVSALKKLVGLYEKTGCSITEDYENYVVMILFDGMTGKPYNFEQMKAAIEEVKPAHLSFEYLFVRNTWGDARQKFGIWGKTGGYTWNGAAYYGGKPENIFKSISLR